MGLWRPGRRGCRVVSWMMGLGEGDGFGGGRCWLIYCCHGFMFGVLEVAMGCLMSFDIEVDWL